MLTLSFLEEYFQKKVDRHYNIGSRKFKFKSEN